MRSDDYELLYVYDDQRYELYDLDGDVSETTNLIDSSDPSRLAAHQLNLPLRDYLSAVGAQTPTEIATGQPAPSPVVLPAP